MAGRDAILIFDCVTRIIAIGDLCSNEALDRVFLMLGDCSGDNDEPHVKAFIKAAMQYISTERQHESRQS